jgi:hypothetical protein
VLKHRIAKANFYFRPAISAAFNGFLPLMPYERLYHALRIYSQSFIRKSNKLSLFSTSWKIRKRLPAPDDPAVLFMGMAQGCRTISLQ